MTQTSATRSGLAAAIMLLASSSFLFPQSAKAQITEETYERAAYYHTNSIQKQVYHLEVIPNWIQGKAAFWHVTYTSDGKRFFYTDLDQKSTREAFDHAALASALESSSNQKTEAANLPFDQIGFTDEGMVEFEWRNKTWLFDPVVNTLESREKEPTPERNSGISPDGKWKAFTRNHNLYVTELETGKETQLSFNGKEDYTYASSYGWSDFMYGENGSRPGRFTVNWSPDSKKILTQVVDTRLAEKMFLLDFSKDEKFRPDLVSYFRGSPGDTTVVMYTPVLFDLETGQEKTFPGLKTPHFIGSNLRWDKTGTKLTGFLFPRGYKTYSLIELDVATAEVRTVYTETSDTHIERDNLFRQLSDGQFILNSEKSGWNQLYLYDWENGQQVRQLTSGEFVVKNILHVDEEAQLIYFTASGREKDRNPYYPHLYKAKLDGSQPTLLTPENAFHDLRLSHDKKYLVDNYSTVDQPTESVVRELATGKIVHRISKADISNLTRRGHRFPRQFTATAKDGKTTIYGIYFLPGNFDESGSYPIIDYTYSGPHIDITPKTFKAGLIGLQQPMAELGFVVVTVDGLGTAGRSKAFAEFSYRNLGDGTTDHVLAIRQLAREHAFMDVERVGIFGHSAGGYDAARAMLLHPDFYKVGVASAGDHDHRMEKAWWPEMYMGYPVGDFYHDQSNVTHAANLKGKLLLAHGGIDENVNPSATYKFAEALIREGKDFDLFIWPSRNHDFGRATGDYFTKKRWDYFIEHLLGEQPLIHYKVNFNN